MAGNAKSYAERLFTYPAVGPLDHAAALSAIQQPIVDEGERIEPQAVEVIADQTRGYPYFLQEWGFQAWNQAEGPSITVDDVKTANASALRRLDASFFNVRLERLTPKERDYVFTMASLGDDGPYRSTEVAHRLGESSQSMGPIRAKLISKGMVYSPAHGDIAFTVPMFADFLRRNFGERFKHS